MKSMSKILSAALMTSTLAAAPAFAASHGASIGAGANVTAGASSSGQSSADGTLGVGADISGNAGALKLKTPMEPTGEAAASGQATVSEDEVIALIDTNAKAAVDVRAMTKADNVTVVRVDTTANAAMEDIDSAVRKNQTAVNTLRSALMANSELNQSLGAQGVDIASIVAAKAGADGSLTVYVR